MASSTTANPSWRVSPTSGKKLAVVSDWGAFLGVRNGLISCYVGKELKWSASPAELWAVVITVTCSVSTEVVKICNEYGIDLVFQDGNKPVARILNAKYGGFMRVWTAQFKTRRRNDLAVAIVRGKIRNQVVTLRYYSKKYDEEEVKEAVSKMDEILERDLRDRKEALQAEAEAAKFYWRAVARLLPQALNFRGRKKRGAEDPFNVALNVGYALLRNVVWKAVINVGLNPYLSYLHKFRAGRPSLVLDLMEEFRSPFVDRPLISSARQDPKRLSDLKSVYSLVLSSIREDEVFTQARKFVDSLVEGCEYKPFRAK
ncbi:CRISPR-associated endonuclease Cas1 [Metallosphaera yellowstonensis MK1]|uniref:CRISPR-associated endonuclease Cas1 n=1 Tax=Metallosphaera yellowstonensis MK1 TaxID=671065 RepID=H2C0Y2_9CREN|nr:CRISPR-associated endonuclease Cas1 [Metallosphaera yellowstonensis]EHP69931.1 CRISPR-associated endonuclease Cas1 [Metallosphaera yellowstonensis MK1]